MVAGEKSHSQHLGTGTGRIGAGKDGNRNPSRGGSTQARVQRIVWLSSTLKRLQHGGYHVMQELIVSRSLNWKGPNSTPPPLEGGFL